MTRLLVLDTETGGIDPISHSILSIGAAVWDDGTIRGEFETLIAEPVLTVTPRALEINNINLVEHCKLGVPPDEAMQRFRLFLTEFMGKELQSEDKITLVGHNIGFDVGFLKRLCRLAGIHFEDMFSHRMLDTAGLLRFLTLTETLPLSGAGLTEALEYFQICVATDLRHTALGDARATAQLLTKLVNLVQKEIAAIKITNVN
jgi:DNA polymerase III epsilon subunit-like protein